MRQGDVLFESGQYAKAIEAYNEYLKSNQADVTVLYNRGRSYEELGKSALAIEDFEAVLKMDKRNITRSND